MVKNILCNKSKNASVRFLFVCLLCMCNFSLHLKRFKVICTLVSAIKSKMAVISMETKRGEKNYFGFFLHIFHTDHNKCTMK